MILFSERYLLIRVCKKDLKNWTRSHKITCTLICPQENDATYKPYLKKEENKKEKFSICKLPLGPVFHCYLTYNSRNNGTQTGLVNINYYTKAPSCPFRTLSYHKFSFLAMAFLQNCSPERISSLRQQRQNTAEFLSYFLCLQGLNNFT